jgi:hypothetical protein
MLTRALSLLVLAAMVSGPAPAAPKGPKPSAQPQSEPQDRDERYAPPPRMAAPPEYAPPPPTTGYVAVPTERQKQCRVRYQCSMDPRDPPCPPCLGL